MKCIFDIRMSRSNVASSDAYFVGVEVLLSQRNGDGEYTPGPKGTLYPDSSTVELCKLLDESEADAGALMRSARGPLDPMKALEHIAKLGLRNSASGVLHRNQDMIVHDPLPEHDAPLLRKIECVGE